MIYKFFRGDPNIIYRFSEKYDSKERYQVVEETFKNRTSAEIYYLNRENEFNKIAFSIAGQNILACCIEVLERTGTIKALMYRHYHYGIIWIELL